MDFMTAMIIGIGAGTIMAGLVAAIVIYKVHKEDKE